MFDTGIVHMTGKEAYHILETMVNDPVIGRFYIDKHAQNQGEPRIYVPWLQAKLGILTGENDDCNPISLNSSRIPLLSMVKYMDEGLEGAVVHVVLHLTAPFDLVSSFKIPHNIKNDFGDPGIQVYMDSHSHWRHQRERVYRCRIKAGFFERAKSIEDVPSKAIGFERLIVPRIEAVLPERYLQPPPE